MATLYFVIDEICRTARPDFAVVVNGGVILNDIAHDW